MKGFATKAVHGPRLRKEAHGALRTPVFEGVAFEFDNARDLQLAFEGKKPAHAYSRITNPTVEDFEQRIRLLADAAGVIALSSGMAAIANTIMAIAGTGTNIVTSRFLFGHTLSLFAGTLKDWGLEVRFADMKSPDSISSVIDASTRLVFLEAITNPQLEVADLRKLTDVASRYGVPVVLDGTCTTPYLLKSRDFGVAVEVLSSTKFISGGATSVGGLVIDNGLFDWSRNPRLTPLSKQFGPMALIVKLRREVYRNFGACMSPHTASMQSLGLETLPLRIERACANALAISRVLASHAKVNKVNYPGLTASPDHALAAMQLRNGFGAILTFDLASREQCYRFMDALQLIRRATNLNDNKTLIIHPATTIFADYTQEERDALVSDATLRLSVGIEDAEDIAEDLEKGFAAL